MSRLRIPLFLICERGNLLALDQEAAILQANNNVLVFLSCKRFWKAVATSLTPYDGTIW